MNSSEEVPSNDVNTDEQLANEGKWLLKKKILFFLLTRVNRMGTRTKVAY